MLSAMEILAQLLIFIFGLVLLLVILVYVLDKRQTKHAIRRNFPVIGRFRYLFERLGDFFRQYFFAMDREELPFNRAERAWVYRSAKGEDNTVGFGSTRDLRPVGTVLFVNDSYPTLEKDAVDTSELVIGKYSEHPYAARSVFHISGMSYGSISRPAVKALSIGAKEAGIWMNTGEGGLSDAHIEGGADIVFQIGTAKYGVRDDQGIFSDERLAAIAMRDQIKMFEIKLSQGAKPGKGGILPAEKVTSEIAIARSIPEGHESISPNRHPEIGSENELLDFIARVAHVTGKPTGIKTVIGSFDWIERLCQSIIRRGIETAPDFITIDSADGGTGAAPMSLIDYMGLPIKESLPVVVDILNSYGLRDRIKVISSGKLVTPAEVAWALCAGADCVVSARGFMFALGCIQALQCHKNTCPTGITTHDPRLQKGLDVRDKSRRVARYAKSIRKEIGVIAHSCGVSEPRELSRGHCRIVQADGLSKPLSELFPDLPLKKVDKTIEKMD